MKLLLDIKDAKVSQFMEVLKGLSYVKAKPSSTWSLVTQSGGAIKI